MAFIVKKKKKELPLPLDSFSDIAFLLIIFFILTTQIQKLTGLTTELPASKPDTAQQAEKTPTVALDGGTIMLDDSSVSLRQLATALKAMKLGQKEPSQRVVLLESGKTVTYQRQFEVMATITAADGVIGILTEDD
ncbi:MAG: biopolymer transporter ExbD [Lentisphaeria bacterium]|nr:biopolymer transporter ExbD [Lentisphaeria bacterium]NQZ69820.1 biopolymer transporter ExbD [Lentisphaeria bacterium]